MDKVMDVLISLIVVTSLQFPSLHAFISSEAQRALKPD